MSPPLVMQDGPRATDALVVRHGESVWNAEGRWQGWADPPLTAEGEAQAALAAQSPVLSGVSAVVSSDLRRARRTAEIIAAERGLGRPETHLGLRERGQGDWTGLTRPEIKRRWPAALKQRPHNPPGGEDLAALIIRAVRALHRVAADNLGGRVLVVSHSGLLRALERHLSVDAPPVAHLAGRWITVADRQIWLQERIGLLLGSAAESPRHRVGPVGHGGLGDAGERV